jgi:hypothetical protein
MRKLIPNSLRTFTCLSCLETFTVQDCDGDVETVTRVSFETTTPLLEAPTGFKLVQFVECSRCGARIKERERRRDRQPLTVPFSTFLTERAVRNIERFKERCSRKTNA